MWNPCKIKTIVAVYLLPLLQTILVAQPTSFQVKLDTLPTPSGYNDLIINEQDKILMLINEAFLPQPDLNHYYIIPVDGQTGPSTAIKIKYPLHKIQWISANYWGDRLMFATKQGDQGATSRQVLSSIDMVTGENWSKKISASKHRFIANLSVEETGNIILVNGVPYDADAPIYPQVNVVELFKFSPNGSTIWKKGSVFTINGSSQGNLVSISKVVASNSQGIYFVGHFATTINLSQQQGPQFIVKLDPLGNPVQWKIIKNLHFYDMIVTDDGIYLWDKNPHFNFNDIEVFDLDKSSTRLVKLDHDLNFLWAKRYQAENFNYFTASITKTSTGKLVMAHATFGAFPVVLTELDNDGNILSQKGYPNYQPNILAMSDGSLLLGSPYADDGFNSLNPIIAKTGPNGAIAGCPNFETCMTMEDISIEFDTFQIDTISIMDLEVLPPIEIQPITVSFQSYCDYPPVPVPTFTFPDTLCFGDTAATVSDGNRLAQAREWHLTGPLTDSLLRDSFEFSYQFTQPGEYLLRQTIWVLGCATDYDRSITVLPPLAVAVAEGNICPGEPLEISADANRAANYTWGTGQSGPTLAVAASGSYTVLATDGICEAADTASVTIVAELLGNNPPFQLPPDTTVCNRDLPFLLVPQSLFADMFFLGNDPVPAASFQLEAAGTYKIGMEAFGCEFEQTFRLVVDCHADIYLPNSFSPNNDGINDLFQPFGNDFEMLALSIFDRWGGLRYQSTEPAAAWDGGKAAQGVYLYKLVYNDLLSGKTEMLEGDVMLVR